MAEKETQRTENTEEASHRSDDEELSDEDLNEVAGGSASSGKKSARSHRTPSPRQQQAAPKPIFR